MCSTFANHFIQIKQNEQCCLIHVIMFPFSFKAVLVRVFLVHMSNEKNPGSLGYTGDYTTQLYGDYNKPQ